MSESRKLKGKKSKRGVGYGTLPEFKTRITVDEKEGLLETMSVPPEGGVSGSYQSASRRSFDRSLPPHHHPDKPGIIAHTAPSYKSASSKQGIYELWKPRSRSASVSSSGSGSSDELFSRTSSSSTSTHCHDLISDPPEDKQALVKLTIATLLSLIFMVLEYVGGYYSSSLAVLSDAGHLLSDFCGFLVSLVALCLIRRPPSASMSFGYYRAEVLGSVASVFIVWVVTGLLVAAAVQRLLYQPYILDPDIMLIMASIGIAINFLIALVLHGCGCHGYFHGAHKSARKNITVRAALIHVVGDTLQTFAVLVAALVVKFWPQYQMADPILTFVFAFIVVVTTLPILRDLAHILMEGTPRNVNYLALLGDLEGLPGVRTVHNLHVWSLTLDKNALSVHLGIDQSFEAEMVLEEAQKLIRSHYFVCKSTIQVERYAREMDTCKNCQPLIW